MCQIVDYQIGGRTVRVADIMNQYMDTINVDCMTDEQLHARLQSGIDDAEAGRVRDAESAFREFKESNSEWHNPPGSTTYLSRHESEVIDMLLTEYDEEQTMKAEYYAGVRAGIAQRQAQYEDQLAAKDAEIADMHTEITDMNARIAQLEARLAASQAQ